MIKPIKEILNFSKFFSSGTYISGQIKLMNEIEDEDSMNSRSFLIGVLLPVRLGC